MPTKVKIRESRERYSEGEEGSGAGPVILLAVLGAGFLLFRKGIKKTVKEVKMVKQVTRMQITNAKVGVNLKHKQIGISFVINNPNPAPMKVQAIVGHITVYQSDPKQPGFRLGDIDRFKPIEIKALSANPVTLTVTLKAVNVLGYLAKMAQGTWKGQIIEFNGTITADGIPFPVNENIRVA